MNQKPQPKHIASLVLANVRPIPEQNRLPILLNFSVALLSWKHNNASQVHFRGGGGRGRVCVYASVHKQFTHLSELQFSRWWLWCLPSPPTNHHQKARGKWTKLIPCFIWSFHVKAAVFHLKMMDHHGPFSRLTPPPTTSKKLISPVSKPSETKPGSGIKLQSSQPFALDSHATLYSLFCTCSS